MDEIPSPSPSPRKPLAQLAAAFAIGVMVALGCVLVGFWMGRRPLAPRTQPDAARVPTPSMPHAATPTATIPAPPIATSGAGEKPGALVSQAAAAPVPPHASAALPPQPAFMIEMSPVASADKAQELVAVLKNLGYTASTVAENTRSRTRGYQVEAGPYGSRDDADLALSKMRLEGLDPAEVVAASPAAAALSSQPAEPSGSGAASAASPGTPRPATAASRPSAQPKKEPPLPTAVAAGFAVQVEARKDRAGAERLVSRLQALGYPASLSVPGPTDRDPLYRVQVGFYATASDACIVRDRLRHRGLRPFIREPRQPDSASTGPQAPAAPATQP